MIIENSRDWKNFVYNVRYIRKSRALSQKKMAGIMGIGVVTLRRIEKGECPKRFGVNAVINIYRYFGISPSLQFKSRLK